MKKVQLANLDNLIAQMSEESSAAADSSADVAKSLAGLANQTKQIIQSYKL